LEHRLRRTFIDDDKAVEFYGSDRNEAVLKLVGVTIQSAAARSPSNNKVQWLDEQWLFDEVTDAIRHMLLWFRPGGDSVRNKITLSSTTDRIDGVIDEIRAADPSLPITKRSTRQHSMAMLKDKLGGLVDRPHPYDEIRKRRLRLSEQAKRKHK
jgi:hypothetical protein